LEKSLAGRRKRKMYAKNKKYGVVVIENAFVDILSKEVREEDLAALGLAKGTSVMMNGKAAVLNKYFSGHSLVIVPGGSGANVAAHAAYTGAKTAFLGTVGTDPYGSFVESEFQKCNVDPFLAKKPGHTGVCYSLITPDAQRTMAFDGEIAANYSISDINTDVIKRAEYVHTSMYALTAEPQRSAVLHALGIAKKAGAKISFDFANAPLISANRVFVKKFLAKYVDIAVANEDEAEAFSGSIVEAQNDMEDLCETSIVKLGADGSIITCNHTIHKIPAFPAEVVDTTGAGDSLIGTYLGEIALGKTVREAGTAASKRAAEIVSRIGAR